MHQTESTIPYDLPFLLSLDDEQIILEVMPFCDIDQMKDALASIADSGFDAYQDRIENVGDADSEDFYAGVEYALEQLDAVFNPDVESEQFSSIWSVIQDDSEPTGWSVRAYAIPCERTMTLEDAHEMSLNGYAGLEEINV